MLPAARRHHSSARPPGLPAWTWLVMAGMCILAGLAWGMLAGAAVPPAPPPLLVTSLVPGSIATLDSPVFSFSPGWQVSKDGADPQEPDDPWTTPAGMVDFEYEGRALALQIAVGDYWGYLYVTVDGQPANRLAAIAGNPNSRDERAGYRTFYAPEVQTDSGPTPEWVVVHRASTPGPHSVSVEVWRAWGQTPLRAVAVDAIPAQRPAWPGALLLMMGGWLALGAWPGLRPRMGAASPLPLRGALDRLLRPLTHPPVRWSLAGMAGMLLAVAVGMDLWGLSWVGLALLGYVSLAQPSLWVAALLLALPFYFSWTLPILPGRATNLIELGLLGGLAVAALHRRFAVPSGAAPGLPPAAHRWARRLGWVLAALISWALVATFAAEHRSPALREWRTVFLAAGLFAVLLHWTLAAGQRQDRMLLAAAWLAGATLVAAIGLGQFAGGVSLIEAEGVQRIRAFYGSPNNLALYLERTLIATLAFVLLTRGRLRWVAAGAAAIQGAALLLTFSKGSLILGLPAGLVSLWLGGWWVLRKRSASRRPLAWIAVVVAAAAILLLPFLGAERFQRLFDLSQGTGYLRLLLWRSAWQMALDHAWLGVGPDNFLYAFRSIYLLPEGWQEPNLNHPHNWPLDWWTRLGVPGLVLGTAFFASGLALLWSRLRAEVRGPASDAALWLGLLASAVTALAHGLIDLSYATPDLMLVWVLVFYLAAAPSAPGNE